MEKIPEQRKEKGAAERYSELIDVYQSKVGELKKLHRRIPSGVVDEEFGTALRVIDQERHKIHLEILELGKRLRKSKDDVLVDLIRKDGTLDEYGLPEFSILIKNDLIDTGDWHDQLYFNVNAEAGRPSNGTVEKYITRRGVSIIKSNEIMIVFAIVPIEKYSGEELDPEDYAERLERAIALTEVVGGKIFESRDTGYHHAYAKILGVIVPKKDLEKIAAIIRDNPNKYRLGKAFYEKER